MPICMCTCVYMCVHAVQACYTHMIVYNYDNI